MDLLKPQKGLRFMVYDSTYLKDDVFTKDDSLTYSWILGGNLYAAMGRFDYRIQAENWVYALGSMASIAHMKNTHIEEIQFWGHGSPGRVWVGRESLSMRHLRGTRGTEIYQALNSVKEHLKEDSLVWFRTCSTFCGYIGQEFALQLCDLLQCKVAGHTHVIHAWQGGLHSLTPGNVPDWDPEEGIEWGTADSVTKTKWSIPFYTPNTIFCLTANLPKDW